MKRRARMMLLGSVLTTVFSIALSMSDRMVDFAIAGKGTFKTLPVYGIEKTNGNGKISNLLKTTVSGIEKAGFVQGKQAQGVDASSFSNRLVRVKNDGSIQAYIHVTDSGNGSLSLLKSKGAKVEIINQQLGIIQAWVPFEKVVEISDIGFVKKITQPSYGRTRAGSVTTEGDQILRADDLRALGFDGTGVKVGVISDGVDNMDSSQASGDLPASVEIVRHQGSGDEGTAMLEIVHDLAPGAELGFCGGLETNLAMIQCVNDLANVFDADVIVDDLGFFLEPYFEDGAIAQAVSTAISNGAVYTSSAGNEADVHYQGAYVDSGNGPNSHDFGGGDTTIPVESNQGDAFVVLQWSNEFGNSDDDYDLCLTDESGDTQIACSEERQNGNDDPIEALILTCDFAEGCVGDLQINRFSGSSQTLEMYFLDLWPTQYNVTGDSIFGHPAVSGALAAGAIEAEDPQNDDIEFFSSQGPVTIFFPAQETRAKPDVSAIDGVSITGAGGFPNPFYGTSAAAPHVAGVAALLKEGFSTNTEIANAIRESAVDLGASGDDPVFGAGRVDAYAAGEMLNDPPESVIDTPASDVTVNKGESVNFTGSCNDENSQVNMSVLWNFGTGSGISNSTAEDPGAQVFNNTGTYTVNFTCTDGFGDADSTAATRTITVKKPGGGGGGGCLVGNPEKSGSQINLLISLVPGLLIASLLKAKKKRG